MAPSKTPRTTRTSTLEGVSVSSFDSDSVFGEVMTPCNTEDDNFSFDEGSSAKSIKSRPPKQTITISPDYLSFFENLDPISRFTVTTYYFDSLPSLDRLFY